MGYTLNVLPLPQPHRMDIVPRGIVLQNPHWGGIDGSIESQTDLIEYIKEQGRIAHVYWGAIDGSVESQADLIKYIEDHKIPYDDSSICADIDMLYRIKADKTELPTAVSELANDADYLPHWQAQDEFYNKQYIDSSLSEYTKTVDLPTKVSQFENDAEYLVAEDVEYLKKNAYRSIDKVEDFLYETIYESLDYDYARQYAADRAPAIVGSCSALRTGNFVGRNYDWLDNYDATFIVKTPNAQGHYAVIGIASSIPNLTIQKVDSREYSDDYKILPFFLQDGINEKGLFAEINVVPATGATRTIPLVEKTDSVCSVMLVRYILDKYQSVDEAVNHLRNHVEIFNSTTLSEMGYEPHFMLADSEKTVVLEIVGNQLQVINSVINTNFHLNGVTFNADGTVYTPATAAQGQYPTSQGIEPMGTGLERWNILDKTAVDSLQTMKAAMDSVLFSKAYTLTENKWYSEFVGGDITVDTPSTDSDFNDRVNYYQSRFPSRTKGVDNFWITAHQCIYDLDRKEFIVSVQENNNTHFVNFVAMSDDNIATIDYVDEQVAEVRAEIPVVPTVLSAFENDADFITETAVRNEFYTKQYIDSSLSEYTKTEDLPTNVSYFVNDAGYLTQHQSLVDYATKVYVDASVNAVRNSIPTNLSQFNNDSGFITNTALQPYAKTAYVNEQINAVRADMPVVPTLISAFFNDVGYLTSHQSLANYYTKTEADGLFQGMLTAGVGIAIENNVIRSTIDSTLFIIVEQLPTTDIKTNKIYLLLDRDGSVGNIYIEYIYVNGQWEQIGKHKGEIDLSNYYTKAEVDASINAVRNIIIEDERSFGASITGINNRLDGIDASLNLYATMDWVEDKGYITSAALNGYATETWVNNQGFLTTASLDNYATKTWVGNQGFLTSAALSGYATETWVEEQGYITNAALIGYATETWVNNQGFLKTHQSLDNYYTKAQVDASINAVRAEIPSLSGYATETWVNEQGFLKSASLDDYATKTWVEAKGYITSAALSGYATQTWVNEQGFLKSASLDGYATQTWVNNQGFLKTHQDITGKENISNKVTTISSASTNTQYPSAKCVYDIVGNIETLLNNI